MSNIRNRFWFLNILLLVHFHGNSQTSVDISSFHVSTRADSIPHKNRCPRIIVNDTSKEENSIFSSFYVSVSSSYSSSENWAGQNFNNFTFVGNVLYNHNLMASKHNHAHQFIADLSYIKFIDSIWIKNIDRLQLNFLWNTNKSNRFKQSYTIAFGSQLFPSQLFIYDRELNQSVNKPIGGFLNPFSLDLGYGTVFSFWESCNINFAFATIKFSSSPKAITPVYFSDRKTTESKNAYYFMNYGFSFSTSINKQFGHHIQWINNSRFFGNGVDRDHVNLDFSNMVIFKIWKYIQARIDTRFVYNPLLNYQVQFRQEVLIGFFYEHRR